MVDIVGNIQGEIMDEENALADEGETLVPIGPSNRSIAKQLEDKPCGSGIFLLNMQLEDALRTTELTFANIGLNYTYDKKIAVEVVIQFLGDDRTPPGRIEIKQMRGGVLYTLWFNTIEQWRKAHQIGLIDEFLRALEWPELYVFGLALVKKGENRKKSLYYDRELGKYQNITLTAPEIGKVIEVVLARNFQLVDSPQSIGSTVAYRVKMPGDETQCVRIIFSPGVQDDGFHLKVELEQEFENIIDHFQPISAPVRFVRKVEHEIYKELRRANNLVSAMASTEQSKKAAKTIVILKRTEFLQQLKKAFNDDELATLCFQLNVDYDDLSGDNRKRRFLSLIGQLERENCVYEFIELCKQERPQYSWDGFVSS